MPVRVVHTEMTPQSLVKEIFLVFGLGPKRGKGKEPQWVQRCFSGFQTFGFPPRWVNPAVRVAENERTAPQLK